MITTKNSHSEEGPRLLHFPISFFAVAMGLGGLALAWKEAGIQFSPYAYQWIGMLTTVVFMVITLMYVLKIIKHPKAVFTEIRHPIRLNFFPAFSISLLLLSAVWKEVWPVSQTLWVAGAVIQLCLTTYILNGWINHTHYKLIHANPSWFIPVVGNIIVPVTGVHLGYTEISWFFYSIGIVFWIILFSIVMYRLFFYEPLPVRMVPMLLILLPPPFIGFVSYSTLIGGVDSFARVLYYVGLFLTLLLLSNIVRFIKIPFSISSWAYSFPVAAVTIATAKMSGYFPNVFFKALTQVLLVIVTILLGWLVFRTIKAIINQEICTPE